MYIDLSSLIVIMCFAAVCLVWWKAREAQERALRAARAYCEKMGLQLLDECVVQSHWRFKRGQHGRIEMERHYEFEFTSTGNDRYFGQVTMHGAKLHYVNVEPHRLQ